MAVDAKPYQEGKGWAIRLRYKGNDIYLSGRKTAAAATKDAQKEVNHIDKYGQPAWGGPKGKTVAQALQRHGAQTLRFKKGGAQEARRINCFLRHGGLDELVLTKLPDGQAHHEELPADGRPSEKVPVYLLFGNHDAESEMTRKLDLPDNVTCFPASKPETFRIEGLSVALHGHSFKQKETTSNLVMHYPAALPGHYNIGVLHTALEGYGPVCEQVNPGGAATDLACAHQQVHPFGELGQALARERACQVFEV